MFTGQIKWLTKYKYRRTAVVAEWLRRLTRNQFPSGSVGSNPTNCDTFGKTETKQLAPGEARTHNPGISFVLSISTVR